MKIPTQPIRLLLAGTLLLLSQIFSYSQEKSEVDAFLATPVPTASIPEESARQTIERGSALAANNAGRSEEISAYLIPFQRAIKAPAEEKAAPAPMPPPPPKPFLIFKTSDGVAEAFKATVFSTQGDLISAQSDDGKRGMWQKSRFVSQLPWYSYEEMETGAIDLESLLLRYKALQSTFPSLKPEINAEVERIQAVVRKFAEAAEQKRAKLLENAAKVIAQANSYSMANPYTTQDLARLLIEAEEARKVAPDQSAKIDKAMAPFRKHFENLLADRILVAGTWTPKATIEEAKIRKQMAEEAAAFEKSLHFELNSELLPQSTIKTLLILAAILAVVVFGLGLYLLAGNISLPARAAGVLLCLAPASLWIYCHSHLLAPYPSPPSFSTDRPDGANKVIRVLFLAGQPTVPEIAATTHRITLRESDLNSFFRDYVKFSSPPNQAGICRTALAFQLLSEEVIIWELAQYNGQPLRIRYDLKTEGSGFEMQIAELNVAIGNLVLPSLLAREMVGNLRAELDKIVKGMKVHEAFKITRLTEGETDLTNIQHPIPPAPVTPEPAPTPAVSGTEPAAEYPPLPGYTPADRLRKKFRQHRKPKASEASETVEENPATPAPEATTPENPPEASSSEEAAPAPAEQQPAEQ